MPVAAAIASTKAPREYLARSQPRHPRKLVDQPRRRRSPGLDIVGLAAGIEVGIEVGLRLAATAAAVFVRGPLQRQRRLGRSRETRLSQRHRRPSLYAGNCSGSGCRSRPRATTVAAAAGARRRAITAVEAAGAGAKATARHAATASRPRGARGCRASRRSSSLLPRPWLGQAPGVRSPCGRGDERRPPRPRDDGRGGVPLRRLRRRPSRRGLGEAAMAAVSVIGFVGVGIVVIGVASGRRALF